MFRSALLALLLMGCNFDGSTASGRANGDGAVPDADLYLADARTFIDAAPMADAISNCNPDDTFCIGDSLEECNPSGTGTTLLEECDFACVDDDHCIGTSNLSGIHTDLCDQFEASLPLAPAQTATITIANNGGNPEIRCNPDCGDGTTTVIPTSTIYNNGGMSLAMFCLSVMDLAPGADIDVEDNIPQSIALVVQSHAKIASEINFSGGEHVPFSNTAGPAGPGGGQGGAHSTAVVPPIVAVDGSGLCPGRGGETGGASDDYIGGGGGGGSYGGLGGPGGDGQSGNNGDIGSGGAGGMSCGTPAELQPLHGGSGGGRGGQGLFPALHGWPGGGGGGALQISARDFIEFSGRIFASGGDGYDLSGNPGAGGGGGGGSGGAILLESRSLTISGAFEVEGGKGGQGSSGEGGGGGSDDEIDGQEGSSQDGSNESGAGGGGGGGRVRLNAASTPNCTNVSPASACSAGLMPLN